MQNVLLTIPLYMDICIWMFFLHITTYKGLVNNVIDLMDRRVCSQKYKMYIEMAMKSLDFVAIFVATVAFKKTFFSFVCICNNSIFQPVDSWIWGYFFHIIYNLLQKVFQFHSV